MLTFDDFTRGFKNSTPRMATTRNRPAMRQTRVVQFTTPQQQLLMQIQRLVQGIVESPDQSDSAPQLRAIAAAVTSLLASTK
jgi:hypothetical protein